MISIITPLEENRLPLFQKTVDKYLKNTSVKYEFIIPSRTLTSVDIYCYSKRYGVTTTTIPYVWDKDTFNPAMALNLGVASANYDHVIITSPEVMPLTDVLSQLKEEIGNNVICQVFDQNEDGTVGMSLVNSKFRTHSPCMYFLALFNRQDILDINGWDEDFMEAYGYEDDDFGDRFIRAGKTFKVRDDIQALHQWHHRPHSDEGVAKGSSLFMRNKKEGIIKPKNGLVSL